jgi:hypothetical protein
MPDNASAFRFPSDSQRMTIIGKTGSGKTMAGVWQLVHRSIDRMPWLIFDFKRDTLFKKLDAEEINLGFVPRRPGLYIVRPLPHEKAEVNDYLWKIWEHGKIGLMFDEGYMVTGMPSFRAILTQGRSKRIPVITLSQRPVWLDRFVFSESDFFQVFWLQDARDRKTVGAFLPFDVHERLPDFHSTWYDVPRDKVIRLAPVPTQAAIVHDFKEKLGRKRRVL